MPTPSPIFNPPPDIAGLVIERMTCPQYSLSNIAADHDTTLEALTLWAFRDDIQDKLRAAENLAAQRTRLAAASRSHYAIDALIQSLAGYMRDERQDFLPKTIEGQDCRERSRTNARRAAHLLHKLTRTTPPPDPRSQADRPSDPTSHTPVRRVRPANELPANSTDPLDLIDPAELTHLANSTDLAAPPTTTYCGPDSQILSNVVSTILTLDPAPSHDPRPSIIAGRKPFDLAPPSPSASAPSPSGRGKGEGPTSIPRPVHSTDLAASPSVPAPSPSGRGGGEGPTSAPRPSHVPAAPQPSHRLHVPDSEDPLSAPSASSAFNPFPALVPVPLPSAHLNGIHHNGARATDTS